VAAVAAGLCLSGTQAMAQFTKDELKCESGTAKALGKQVSAQSKCTDKCIKSQRKTSGPYTACFDETTLPCIIDPLKGPAAKASASIGKACAKDCPECYPAGQCTNGQPLVAITTALVDTQGPLVYCTEAGGGTPTKEEAKCEDSTVKALVKFVASINKCYDKCVKDTQAGKLPAGVCAPALGAGAPPPTEAKTLACLAKAYTSTQASIDKACVPALSKPACYGAQDGNGWALLVQTLVSSQVDDISCGSPSGAFIN
jgi:hypothetical protein